MKRIFVVIVSAVALTACDKPVKPPQSNNHESSTPHPPTVVSTVTPTKRTVRATIAGGARIHLEGNAAVVTTDKHKFVVEPERFTIDGVELLKLRPTVDHVEFYLNSQGYFTMNADLAGVATKQLPSAKPFTKQQTGGATRLDGRVVHFSVFGEGTISPEGDTALITTEAHKIVVERERVTVNGAEAVKLAPASKDIRVTLTEAGRFNVVADGSTVLSNQLSK